MIAEMEKGATKGQPVKGQSAELIYEQYLQQDSIRV